MFAAGIPDQFWLDILNAVHHPDDDYKIALYLQSEATDKDLSATTYGVTGELETAGGYSQGGKSLSGRTIGKSGKTFWLDFDDPNWAKASFTADAAVIYNASKENKILVLLGFGSTTATNGTFTVELPPAGPSAVITIWNVHG